MKADKRLEVPQEDLSTRSSQKGGATMDESSGTVGSVVTGVALWLKRMKKDTGINIVKVESVGLV